MKYSITDLFHRYDIKANNSIALCERVHRIIVL